jgi:hypothetical protein
MDAGSNLVNSSSDAVAGLISQSTGGRINLQSSPEFGQASTSTAGAPITDASQLSEFMSGLNEQANRYCNPRSYCRGGSSSGNATNAIRRKLRSVESWPWNGNSRSNWGKFY